MGIMKLSLDQMRIGECLASSFHRVVAKASRLLFVEFGNMNTLHQIFILEEVDALRLLCEELWYSLHLH